MTSDELRDVPRISLGTLFSPLLRGKLDGRRHFGLLCAELCGKAKGSVICLDFALVEDVSASWIAVALVPLLGWAADPENDFYPILGGVLGGGKKWEDEFELVASRANAPFLAVDSAGSAQILGTLDPILADTLRLVQLHSEVTGAGLCRLAPEESIGATAWSNRLKDLHRMRLVKRLTWGREQLYSTVLEVIVNGPASSKGQDRGLPAEEAT